jgi:hypothetical protein
MFLAEQVQVCAEYGTKGQSFIAIEPSVVKVNGAPDRILPILASPGLIGEIRIWRGNGWLPAEGSRLLSNITSQASQALERARLAEAEELVSTNLNKGPAEG